MAVLIVIFLLFVLVDGQICNSNMYTITNNNDTTLITLDKYRNLNVTGNMVSDGYCKCNPLIGDGSSINNLQNNTIITNLISQVFVLQNLISSFNQTVAFSAYNDIQTTFTSTHVTYKNVIYDTHNSHNLTSGQFVIPITGTYNIDIHLSFYFGYNVQYILVGISI